MVHKIKKKIKKIYKGQKIFASASISFKAEVKAAMDVVHPRTYNHFSFTRCSDLLLFQHICIKC